MSEGATTWLQLTRDPPLADAVTADHATTPIEQRTRAILDFVRKLTPTPDATMRALVVPVAFVLGLAASAGPSPATPWPPATVSPRAAPMLVELRLPHGPAAVEALRSAGATLVGPGPRDLAGARRGRRTRRAGPRARPA